MFVVSFWIVCFGLFYEMLMVNGVLVCEWDMVWLRSLWLMIYLCVVFVI